MHKRRKKRRQREESELIQASGSESENGAATAMKELRVGSAWW